MPTPLSDILVTDFFNQAKYHLPISKRGDDTSIQIWIKNAMSRYNKLYIDNNKGIFDVVEQFDFYNVNSFLNLRGLNTSAETRWCLIQPSGLYMSKLMSCMLQTVVPNGTVLPVDVAYIQDIPIGVTDSKSVNTQIPATNSGLVALVGGVGIVSVLTLDNTGTVFSDIVQITAVYSYYRNVLYPNFAGTDSIDIQKKDVELVLNYVVDEAYSLQNPPVAVDQQIQEAEMQIIY